VIVQVAADHVWLTGFGKPHACRVSARHQNHLTAALGLKGVSAGQRWTAPAGLPALSGVVEHVTQSPFNALLRLDKPGPASPP